MAKEKYIDKIVKQGALEVGALAGDRITHKGPPTELRSTTLSNALVRFFDKALKTQMRKATMMFIDESVGVLTKLSSSIIDSRFLRDFLTRTIMMYETYVKTHNLGDDVTKARTDVALWERVFKALCRINIAKSATSIALLMQIENDIHQNDFMRSLIAGFIEDQEQINLAIDWIRIFNLDDIKNTFFNNIVINSYIFQNNKFLCLLTSRDDELRYVKLLDDLCYRDFFDEKAILQGEIELRHANENLSKITLRASKRYEIDVYEEKLAFRRILVIKDLLYKISVSKRDGETDDLVLRAIGLQSHEWHIDFVKAIQKRNTFKALCWAKYFKVRKYECNIHMHRKLTSIERAKLAKFSRAMELRARESTEADTTTKVDIFGTEFTLRKVSTPSGLTDFTDNWLSIGTSQVIGIDCESGSVAAGFNGKVALLQLATKDWLAVIDIVSLYGKATLDQWKAFFTALLDPSITRIGYAFYSDYVYLRGMFPELCELFQAPESKVHCLLLYIQTLLVNKDASSALFSIQGPPESISLSDVTECILGLHLDKTCRISDWTQRPLTEEQISYAVKDALVVILIRDKIEGHLKDANLTSKRINGLFEDCTITMPHKVKSTEGIKKITNIFADIRSTVIEASNRNKEKYGDACVAPSTVALLVDAAFLAFLPYLNHLGIKTTAERRNNKPVESEFKDNADLILITTTKRTNEYPFIPSDRVIGLTTCGDVAGLPQFSKIVTETRVCFDPERDFFKICEKCASTRIRYFPTALYELLFVIQSIFFTRVNLRRIQTMDDILEIAKRIQTSDGVSIESANSEKPIGMFNVDCLKVKVLQQPVLVLPKTDKKGSQCDRPIKPSATTYAAASVGVDIRICFDCVHFFNCLDCGVEKEREIQKVKDDLYADGPSPIASLPEGFAGTITAIYNLFNVSEKVNGDVSKPTQGTTQ